MITIKDTKYKGQLCNSCYDRDAKEIKIKPPMSSQSNSIVLCNDCLFLLISKIKEALGE